MGTNCFIAIGVFSVELFQEPAKFQCSAVQIGQDSLIYLHDVKLG